jgi:hypothetical protein
MKIIYRQHAIQRMFERDISDSDVKAAVKNGTTVEDYPNDTPYPSRLILGFAGSNPLHVVYADNHDSNERIIITVYEPNLNLWDTDLKTRRKR